MSSKTHWEHIFTTKDSQQVSWYQPHLQMSLNLIERTGIDKQAQIIDVGGGTSTLIDDLLEKQYRRVSVLDLSAAALQQARTRLGAAADAVMWIEADVTEAELLPDTYDLWHDRAVFHFLTDAESRQKYVQQVKRAVKSNGHVIVATFSQNAPSQCSGLAVVQYNPDTLHAQFGENFKLVESAVEDHQTPFGTQQQFVYCYCRKG